eukprot:1846831-Amphidinium_carterae.1
MVGGSECAALAALSEGKSATVRCALGPLGAATSCCLGAFRGRRGAGGGTRMTVRGRSMGGAAGWKGGGGSSGDTVNGTESGSISSSVLGVANLDLLGGGCMRG